MTRKINLKSNSKVVSSGLSHQTASQDKIYIGSKHRQKFLLVKKQWLPLIKLLKKPTKVSQIASKLTKIDPTNFPDSQSITKTKIMLLLLAQHSLIEKIDNIQVANPKDPSRAKPIPKWPKKLVTRPLISIYLLVALLAPVLMILFPSLIPKFSDFFWNQSYSFSLLTFFIFSWLISFQHEIAHYIAATSQGITSRFSLSHRLNFLVLQTSYQEINHLKKSPKILIFISAIVIDLATITILSFYLINFPESGLVKQILLLEWLSLSWHFLFFMKTDIYYVIKEVVCVENLYTYAIEKITSLFTARKVTHQLSKKESLWVNLYTVFFILGTVLAALRYGFFHLPIVLTLLIGSIANLQHSLRVSDFWLLIDSLIIILIQAITTVLLLYAIYKNKKVRIRI